MTQRDEPRRIPLPSEDEGDLVETPPQGVTDDHLVAEEEGVPYVPPTDRVLSEARPEQGGPDQAGAMADDEAELRRVTADPGGDDLAARCLEALRRSNVPAGGRLRVGVIGSTAYLRGEVESVDVADELVGILGDVEGVEDVVDETTVRGI